MTSVPLGFNGTHLEFKFTWGVFEALHAEWGDTYETKISDLLTGRNLVNLRYVVALATGVAVSPDQVLPVQKTINAMYRAYELGWSGRDVGPGPEEVSEGTGKKPTPYAKSSTNIWTLGYLWGLCGRIFSRKRRT